MNHGIVASHKEGRSGVPKVNTNDSNLMMDVVKTIFAEITDMLASPSEGDSLGPPKLSLGQLSTIRDNVS